MLINSTIAEGPEKGVLISIKVTCIVVMYRKAANKTVIVTSTGIVYTVSGDYDKLRSYWELALHSA